MNLLDCYVTKVLGEPYHRKFECGVSKWLVDVEYDCYGNTGKTEILTDTKEEAEKVGIGYKFLQ